MRTPPGIPVFTLYGETGRFPDLVHSERIPDRAPAHGWTIAPHRHAQMAQLFLVTEGHAIADIDGTAHVLEGGTLLYVPATAVHAFRFAPGTDGLVQSFPSGLPGGHGAAPSLAQALALPFCRPVPPPLAALMAQLHDVLASTGAFRNDAAAGLTQAILALAAALPHDAAPAAGANRHMAAFTALVATHVADGWSASDYARALSVSTGHLSRICREATGLGAKAYIEQAVMQEAARLLAFTRMTAAEAGYRLGFADPSYFSRRFRKHLGLSPTAYRAQVAA